MSNELAIALVGLLYVVVRLVEWLVKREMAKPHLDPVTGTLVKSPSVAGLSSAQAQTLERVCVKVEAIEVKIEAISAKHGSCNENQNKRIEGLVERRNELHLEIQELQEKRLEDRDRMWAQIDLFSKTVTHVSNGKMASSRLPVEDEPTEDDEGVIEA